MTGGRVVVGVNGTPASRAALRWAAGEAQRRHAGLDVVHVRPPLDGLSPRIASLVTSDGKRHCVELLRWAGEYAAAAEPTVPVRTDSRAGAVDEELIRYADGADLLVVGRHRHDSSEPLLGSVTQRVAAYARTPVAVVPVHGDRVVRSAPPVVAVGVSRSSGRAIDAAFAHALRLGGTVLAVRAWGNLDWAGLVSLLTPDGAERWRLASQHLLDEAVARCRRDYPGVAVQTRLVRGPVLATLRSAAAGAALLVLAGRPRQDPGSSRLGWTATSLLAEAPCPVEIVSTALPALPSQPAPIRTIPAPQPLLTR